MRLRNRFKDSTPAEPVWVYTLVEEGRLSPLQAAEKLSGVGLEPASRPAAPASPSTASELEDLVGLAEVKEVIREIAAWAQVRRRRRQCGLADASPCLHMAFLGNPGTGKTTVARLLARLFCDLGLLSRGHLVEVERADLVGEYIGHTAHRTREQLNRARGGVLFVDEAHSLARGGERDFGREAVDTLVKAMEDSREDLIVVLAGYRREMLDFLGLNPGLRSRLPVRLVFPDFTDEELLAIADRMLERQQYRLAPGCRERLETLFRIARACGIIRASNARLVRNLLEKAYRRQAVRLAGTDATPWDLMALEAADLPGEDFVYGMLDNGPPWGGQDHPASYPG